MLLGIVRIQNRTPGLLDSWISRRRRQNEKKTAPGHMLLLGIVRKIGLLDSWTPGYRAAVTRTRKNSRLPPGQQLTHLCCSDTFVFLGRHSLTTATESLASGSLIFDSTDSDVTRGVLTDNPFGKTLSFSIRNQDGQVAQLYHPLSITVNGPAERNVTFRCRFDTTAIWVALPPNFAHILTFTDLLIHPPPLVWFRLEQAI